VNQFLWCQHLFNNSVAHGVEYVVRDPVQVLYFVEIVQLFYVEQIIHIQRFYEGACLFIHIVFYAAIGYFLDEFFFHRGCFGIRFDIFAYFGLRFYHLYVKRLIRTFYFDNFTCFQNVVGYKTDVFCENDETKLDDGQLGVVFLDVAVEDFQKFGVN
jgi:hypothetical protein